MGGLRGRPLETICILEITAMPTIPTNFIHDEEIEIEIRRIVDERTADALKRVAMFLQGSDNPKNGQRYKAIKARAVALVYATDNEWLGESQEDMAKRFGIPRLALTRSLTALQREVGVIPLTRKNRANQSPGKESFSKTAKCG